MRRRRFSQNDSLEMLLDTITNTFGGILFLSILVAILVQFSGGGVRASAPGEEDDLTDLRKMISQKNADLDSLRVALDAQEETLHEFMRTHAPEQLEEVLTLRSREKALRQQILEMEATVQNAEKENRDVEEGQRELTLQLTEATRREELLRQELREQIKKRTQVARLPSLRATNKREFATVVRYGRLYFLHATNMDRSLRTPNLDDFVLLADEAAVFRLTPKPYAGLPIGETEDFERLLSERLVTLDRNFDYLAIAVWEDSFTDFKYLRKALVELGWEYRLMPVEEGTFVQESDVERTQVQ